MARPSTGDDRLSSWISPRVMSGRSWIMAVSTLATTVATRRRVESLLCSTSRSLSRLMVRMVEAPKPMMRITTISTVIFAVSRSLGTTLDADGPPRPEGLAQDPLHQLARAVPRQRLVERHLARHLVAGQVLPAEGGHPLGVQRVAGARLDGRVHALAPFVVGHAEDRGVLDRRVAVQGVLDLRGVDVDATRDDHVALAVADVHEALGVLVGHVAHAEPLAARGLARGLGLLPVLVEHARVAPHVELAGLPGGDRPPVVVQDGHLDAGRGAAARAGLSQDVGGAEDGVDAELG